MRPDSEDETGGDDGADAGTVSNEVKRWAPLPEKKRRFPIWPWVLCAIVATLVAIVVAQVAYSRGVHDERVRAEALASATVKVPVPDGLHCPEPASAEASRAIRTQPVVTITEAPAQKLLVMRKGVVVVIDAVVTGDVVICGNDAVVMFKRPPSSTARIAMHGGSDSAAAGAGPAVYTMPGIELQSHRVWFSNNKPRIAKCLTDGVTATPPLRSCDSYFSTARPTVSPASTK